MSLIYLCDHNLTITSPNRGIIEGSDDYFHVKDILTDVAKCINKRNGGLWDEFIFDFLGGGIFIFLIISSYTAIGDQMSISAILGRDGRYGRRGQNCNYCEVDSVDLQKDDVSVVRTLSRIYQQCHLFPPDSGAPFTCPSCGKRFQTELDVARESAPSNLEAYAAAHAGASWHKPPLLPIEPAKYIVCCLHMLLSLTKLLFKAAILPMLLTEDLAKTFNTMMSEIGVCIPKLSKIPTDANKSQSRRIKFTGAECLKLLQYWDAIVEQLTIRSDSGDAVRQWAGKA